MSAAIGFFDGFDGILVAIVYGALIAFSILFQVARHFCNKKNHEDSSTEESEDKVDLDASNDHQKMRKINDTQSIVVDSSVHRLLNDRENKKRE